MRAPPPAPRHSPPPSLSVEKPATGARPPQPPPPRSEDREDQDVHEHDRRIASHGEELLPGSSRSRRSRRHREHVVEDCRTAESSPVEQDEQRRRGRVERDRPDARRRTSRRGDVDREDDAVAGTPDTRTSPSPNGALLPWLVRSAVSCRSRARTRRSSSRRTRVRRRSRARSAP